MSRRILIYSVVAALVAAAALTANGCGEEEGISRDAHGQVELGMTMDDVEAALGQPQRSHVTGTTENPSIFWYFTKQDGEGLVKISFESGKVTNIAPYDESFEVGE